jgi:hypothetical protein
MRLLTVVVAFALAFAVAWNEMAKQSSTPTGASKPTITDTKTPKRGATPARSSSKGSTAKVKNAQAKFSAGNSAKAVAEIAKADRNAAKAEAGAERKPEKKTSEVASSDAKQKSEKKTSEVASSDTSSGTRSTANTVSGTSSNTNTSPDTIDFTATAVGRRLQQKSKLRSKIEAKLQVVGYSGTVYEAAYGFQTVEELSAATDLVQNHGYSFEFLKVLMTGKYVDPKTHLVYRAHQAEDGTVKLLGQELATNPVPES